MAFTEMNLFLRFDGSVTLERAFIRVIELKTKAELLLLDKAS